MTIVVQVVCLASSSKGNAYYIEGEEDAVLIDCGISCRRILKALQAFPEAKTKLRGVLVTHEHSDHTQGLPTFLKRTGLPAYASPGTWQALQDRWEEGHLDGGLLESIGLPEGQSLSLGSLTISTHPLSHDAQDPLGFVVEEGGYKVGIATDTGQVTDASLAALYDSDLVILEANHDPHLLHTGPYPHFLKARVASTYGHLSNRSCAQALSQILTRRTRHVVLAHLSEKNNHPRLAFDTVRDSLSAASKRQGALGLWVASPASPLSLNLSL